MSGQHAALAVLERMVEAQNRHDLDAFVACFCDDYRSEQPAYPERNFTGSAQVHKNWSAIFAGVPDFRAAVLRSATSGDEGWAEVHWSGRRRGGGPPLDLRGVLIFGVRDERLAWARWYLQEAATPEDSAGGDSIDQQVRWIAAGEHD